MAANYLKTPATWTWIASAWGLSYGGFFTLIAMTDQPKLFRAGVDVAYVVDYAMYYEDPITAGGRRAASARRIRIRGLRERIPVVARGSPRRPLLVLHGTSDVNVGTCTRSASSMS
jgi:dipeptidyl aminopeptidase/acylaminoacyl peptidase